MVMSLSFPSRSVWLQSGSGEYYGVSMTRLPVTDSTLARV